MKQNILIATLLAAMLALAGCGGGSSSGPAKTDDGNTGDTEPKSVKIPAGKTFDLKAGEKGELAVKAGQSEIRDGVLFECPTAGGDCMATFENSLGTVVVKSTGGLTAKPYVAPTTQPAQQTPPGGDTGPLGDASIIAAINGGKILGLPLANVGGSENTFKDKDGKTTTLRLWSDNAATNGITALSPGEPNKDANYIFWGHWRERTDVDFPGADHKRGLVWGGSKPYGTKPATDLDPIMATYNGLAAHQSSTDGGKIWTDADGPAAVRLTANFKGGFIHGIIDVDTTDVPSGDVTPASGDIMLKTAMFPSGDTFSGSTEVAMPGMGQTKGSGTWEGQFFGPSTGEKRSTRKIEDKAPSHVAGEFQVTHKSSAAETTTIRGTFGAD